jgi:NAD-dependent dihydropyrimidine dehydrogenase PreA subunit
MAIEKIDVELCTGCGICVDSCWPDVIRMDEKAGKAVIRYPEDCADCRMCEADCPEHAIHVTAQENHPVFLTLWGE